MPKRYTAIKRSYRKGHPGASEKEIKSHASRIFIGTADNRHEAAMSLARHRKKKRKKLHEYAVG